MKIARRANPKLWEKVKKMMSRWRQRRTSRSTRKGQIAVALYKKEGRTYVGKRRRITHCKNGQKKSGGYVGKPEKSRYLPTKVREKLTRGEKVTTIRAKNKGSKAGKQFVKQPERIAKKIARYCRA